MALDQQQQQFATSVPATPILDRAMEGLGKGIDYFMNEVVIGKIGGMLDAATAEVRSMGKAAVVDMAGSRLGGDPSSLPPLTPSKGAESSERGQEQQIEKSRVPELQIAMEKSSPSNLAQGLKCENCNMQESGLLASPYTPSTGVNRSQGIGIG
ncbi:MAG: hypothetical protein ABL867_10625 [Rickettsiales bacterium]